MNTSLWSSVRLFPRLPGLHTQSNACDWVSLASFFFLPPAHFTLYWSYLSASQDKPTRWTFHVLLCDPFRMRSVLMMSMLAMIQNEEIIIILKCIKKVRSLFWVESTDIFKFFFLSKKYPENKYLIEEHRVLEKKTNEALVLCYLPSLMPTKILHVTECI